MSAIWRPSWLGINMLILYIASIEGKNILIESQTKYGHSFNGKTNSKSLKSQHLRMKYNQIYV